MNEVIRKKLDDMHMDMLSGQRPHSGYPDPLDFLRVLDRNPDLPETMDFKEFRKAYDWLAETRGQNWSNGRHLFLDGEELAHRAGCSEDALVAAAIRIGTQETSSRVPCLQVSAVQTLLRLSEVQSGGFNQGLILDLKGR